MLKRTPQEKLKGQCHLFLLTGELRVSKEAGSVERWGGSASQVRAGGHR